MTTIPEHLSALHAAYVEATKIDVSLRSYQRQCDLVEIHERGLTPDDIRAVMRELKRLVDSRDPRNDCYTEACLEWRNAMGGVDRLEERAQRIKQAQRRKDAAKPKPQVARTDSLGVSRLDDAPKTEPNVVDLGAALRGMADEIGRKSA